MRPSLALLAALAMTLAIGAPALAGGWAVTTLDSLPPGIQAGQTYDIGYTIRQHGVTPINVEDMGGTTKIQITSPDGAKTLSYAGVREGATGHYVAKVIFPYDGSWTWQVTQGPFEAQSLGKVVVAAAAGAAQPAPAQSAAVTKPAETPAPATNALVLVALLLATAGAAVLFGTRIAAFAARRTAA